MIKHARQTAAKNGSACRRLRCVSGSAYVSTSDAGRAPWLNERCSCHLRIRKWDDSTFSSTTLHQAESFSPHPFQLIWYRDLHLYKTRQEEAEGAQQENRVSRKHPHTRTRRRRWLESPAGWPPKPPSSAVPRLGLIRSACSRCGNQKIDETHTRAVQMTGWCDHDHPIQLAFDPRAVPSVTTGYFSPLADPSTSFASK
jgi:hypothetical protein